MCITLYSSIDAVKSMQSRQRALDPKEKNKLVGLWDMDFIEIEKKNVYI